MQPFEELERKWAEWNDLDPAGMVACSSGTAALHLVLETLRLPVGSEVIVPDFTMIACARAVTLAGLTPMFMDCGLNLTVDFDLMPRGNGVRRTVMPVHVYGRRCDMEKLTAWRNNWPSSPTAVVEDLAEAHGIRPHPQTDAACWSFYRNKIVAGEEGGAVWFRDAEHAALARQLRCLGFTAAHDFNHVPRGHNYRLANALAELALRGLYNYRWEAAARRDMEAEYDRLCSPEWRMPPRDAPWVYDLRVPGLTPDAQTRVVRELQVAGVAARHAFKPMSAQPEYENCRVVSRTAGPRASHAAAREVFYLPLQRSAWVAEGAARDSARIAFEVIERVLTGQPHD